jgi:ribonuclease VapC
MPDRDVYVLDTSALLALRGDEPGADRVEALLVRARKGRATLFVSFITRMELLYRV